MDIKRLINDDGVTDHTALLPTKNRAQVDFDKLSENERKVLELVYQNLEEATSKPYKYEKTTVTISYKGEIFTTTGVRNLELGWKKNRPDETKEQLLPEFKKGQKISIKSAFVEKHQTEPPAHFTEGKLLEAMEVAGRNSVETDAEYMGIGTAATRAEIIEQLVSGGFVDRVGESGQPKVFIPTELSDLLYSKLPDSLRSADMTAQWEAKLSEVEKGTLDPEDFLREINGFVKNLTIT